MAKKDLGQVVPTLATTPTDNESMAAAANTLYDVFTDVSQRTNVVDLLAQANVGVNGRRIVLCNENTLNTPYKAGLTSVTSGVAYINMTSTNYGQIIFVCGGRELIFTLSKTDGSWGDWKGPLSMGQLETGSIEVDCAANGTTQFSVTYDTTFLKNPFVFCTPLTTLAQYFTISVSPRSQKGFTGNVYNGTQSQRTIAVMWLAIADGN